MPRIKKAMLFFAAATLLCGMTEPPVAEFNRHNAAARAARERGDHAAYLHHVRDLHKMLPENPSVLFALARALARSGAVEAAVAQLRLLADQGFAYRVEEDPFFASLRNHSGFRAAAGRLAANETQARSRSAAVITLPPQMAGEAVAWSEAGRILLLGGPGGVHSVGLDGRSDARLLGRWEGTLLGIRPDPRTGTFLVCAGGAETGTSVVLRYRLSDGALLAMYPLPAAGALCNDIALLPDGGFAVTDTNNSALYRLAGSRLEVMRTSRPIFFPNGIATDPAGRRLYVAHAGGIVVHDLSTNETRELAGVSTSLGAIDGMVWHEGSLIGVQNLTVPPRLLRVTPDSDARRARVEVLLANPELLASSLTVAVAGEEAFVVSRAGPPDSDAAPILVRVPI